MDANNGRVLFLDNDLDTCDMMRVLLSNAGYEAVTAMTVTEGLKLARAGDFDLILLDWYFDDGNGLDLCQMIRTFNSKVPIFFYTGVSNESNLNRIAEAGAQGYFIKPVDVGHLLTTLSLQINGVNHE
ncbi:MAG TPA: response regulator [Blastocatellia bacterium]|jgi:DNA-binding response OmpR family regulator